MFKVTFFRNGEQVGPSIDYGQYEYAKKAAEAWNSVEIVNGITINFTTTITEC